MAFSKRTFYDDLAAGRVPDALLLNKFGHNAAVGATEEPIWDAGGAYPWQTSAGLLKIKSTSVADKGTPTVGTGAQTVEIFGLNANYNPITEIIVMNGTSDVDSTKSFLRVNRIIVRTAGSGGANAGTITVKDATNTFTYAQVTIGFNQTVMAIWTVPAGYSFFLTYNYSATSKATQATTIYFRIRPLGEVFQMKRVFSIFQGETFQEQQPPAPIPEKTDLVISGSAVGGSGIVSAGFGGWYQKNTSIAAGI